MSKITKSSPFKGREENCWYWVTDPREGDVWSPIYLRGDGIALHEGLLYEPEDFSGLTIQEAVMPDVV